MSLTGFTDLGATIFANEGKVITDAVNSVKNPPGVTSSVTKSMVKASTLIPYSEATKSQVNDWI